jgi:hypothetical protein
VAKSSMPTLQRRRPPSNIATNSARPRRIRCAAQRLPNLVGDVPSGSRLEELAASISNLHRLDNRNSLMFSIRSGSRQKRKCRAAHSTRCKRVSGRRIPDQSCDTDANHYGAQDLRNDLSFWRKFFYCHETGESGNPKGIHDAADE